MSCDWNCRCPRCERAWDHLTLEREDDGEREEAERYDATHEARDAE